jgi:hypothetical protein
MTINEMRTERRHSEARSVFWGWGILAGLLPLFLLIVSLAINSLFGTCNYEITNIVGYVAVALYGLELLAGIVGLFSWRFRHPALGLLGTLLISAALFWPLLASFQWLILHFLPPWNNCQIRN